MLRVNLWRSCGTVTQISLVYCTIHKIFYFTFHLVVPPQFTTHYFFAFQGRACHLKFGHRKKFARLNRVSLARDGDGVHRLTSISAFSRAFFILCCSKMAALLCSISLFFLSFSSAFLLSMSLRLWASSSFLIFISSCCCLRCRDCNMILSFFLSISSMVTLEEENKFNK